MQCKRCPSLLIVRRGQILAWCPKCRRGFRLAKIKILWSSSNPGELHFLISCVRGWWGHHLPYIPIYKFGGWVCRYRSRSSIPDRRHRQAIKKTLRLACIATIALPGQRMDGRFDQPAPNRLGRSQADRMELGRAMVSTA